MDYRVEERPRGFHDIRTIFDRYRDIDNVAPRGRGGNPSLLGGDFSYTDRINGPILNAMFASSLSSTIPIAMSSSELRVFISSTFRDLQEERDHLVKKVFPEIRALCSLRGITFTEVDLRWGLTEQDVVLGQAIGACLGEIDRCRPYFFGITGDRYGWIPALHDIHKDPDLLARYPWIEEAVAEGASITDLEYRHAALNDPRAAMDSVRFYFRRDRRGPVNYVSDADVPTADATRLEDLQRRVRASGLSVQEFRDPGTLGEMIYDALVEIISRDFTDARPPSALESVRLRHAAFAASRRHAYIPNADYLTRLNEFIHSDASGLVLLGESGAGKSALLAYWAEQYRRKHPDMFVIEHYVGIGAGRTDHLEIIRHIMLEIREWCVVDRELPDIEDAIVRDLPVWLAEIQKEQCVLIIDGLNQLQGAAQRLAWLPRHIPPLIKLIVSTTAEGAFLATRDQRWSQFHIHPLTEVECEAVVVRFLSEYHKALRSDLIKLIAADEKCGKPLFLRTMLEELRVFGRHEDLDDAVTALLATSNTEELFQRMLTRLENDFGPKAVQAIMTLIWASRFGVSENEIVAISELSRLKVSEMVAGLDYHLVRSEGRLTFFHDYLRDAIEHCYLVNDASKRHAHLEIAGYLEQQAIDEHTAMELPWQLREAGEGERLRQALARLDLLEVYVVEEAHAIKRECYELIGYWLECGGVQEMARCYSELLSCKGDRAVESEHEAQLLIGVCELYRVCGNAREGITFARQALMIRETTLGAECPDVANNMNELAAVLMEAGEYAEAEVLFRRALVIGETVFGVEHPNTALMVNNLANLLHQIGNDAEAERLYRAALAIIEAIHGEEHPVAALSLSNLGLLLCSTGRYADAESILRRALAIREVEFGKYHPLVANCLTKLAIVQAALGNYTDAELLDRQALAIYETTLGPEHPYTAFSLQGLGEVFRRQGNLTSAQEYLLRALPIQKKSFGDEHIHTAYTFRSLGMLSIAQGDYQAARELLACAFKIFARVRGAEHDSVLGIRHELEELDRKRAKE